ncbi:MFS transporter [Sphingorhabdus sp.]|jgi:predicted MFS family arabinose efflux permease|uniref:MFS transporter n=1 Tax=Sphingorhabdus sp. TaxID=1902408 RepID=UPI0037C7DBF6
MTVSANTAKNVATPVAQHEWRDGWKLVLAASFGFSFFSIMMAATGLFMEPLGKEFGWSRTVLSSGPSIATIMTAILGPFFGVLIDRYGSRKLALPGIIATIASVCTFGLVNGEQWQWITLWFIFGLVSVTIKSTIWTAAVVGVFEKSRGLALGLTLSGTAVAQAVIPPLGNYLITEFGWRLAFVWLGLGWGGITFLLVWLFLFDVHSRKAKMVAITNIEAEGAVDLKGLTVKQAVRDRALWQLAFSNFIVMTMTMGLTIHLFPILTEAGISREKAALLTAISGVAAIVGKLVTGYLLDRYRPNWVGGLTLAAAAGAFALLIDDISSPTLIVVALIINGYAAGTKTHITGFLTAGYSGMKNFGAIYGFMSALMALASGVGPLLAGYAYDSSGGYGPFLILGAIGCLIGGLLVITLPKAPSWTEA